MQELYSHVHECMTCILGLWRLQVHPVLSRITGLSLLQGGLCDGNGIRAGRDSLFDVDAKTVDRRSWWVWWIQWMRGSCSHQKDAWLFPISGCRGLAGRMDCASSGNSRVRGSRPKGWWLGRGLREGVPDSRLSTWTRGIGCCWMEEEGCRPWELGWSRGRRNQGLDARAWACERDSVRQQYEFRSVSGIGGCRTSLVDKGVAGRNDYGDTV